MSNQAETDHYITCMRCDTALCIKCMSDHACNKQNNCIKSNEQKNQDTTSQQSDEIVISLSI